MNRFEDVRGRTVVSRLEGAIVGKLDDFQFDLRTWEIYGYRLQPRHMFAKAGGVPAERLDQIGRDVAFLGAEADIEWSGGGRNAEDGRAWATRYVGTRVISRDGTALGEVSDLVFDPARRRAVAVILTHDRLAILGPQVATGPAAVVLETASVATPMPAQEDGESPAAWWSRVTAAPSPTPPRGEVD